MPRTTTTIPKVQQAAMNIVTLVTQGFPSGTTEAPINGTAYTAQELLAAVQVIIDDYKSLATAETAYHDAVAELKAKAPGYKSLVAAARSVLKQVYAGNTAALNLLGVSTTPKPTKTTAEKAASAAKAQATKKQNRNPSAAAATAQPGSGASSAPAAHPAPAVPTASVASGS